MMRCARREAWTKTHGAMDLLADTRQRLAHAIRQLLLINAGAPISESLTKEEAINIFTEKIGLFESVLRRYGRPENGDWR
jgi:hypothetical protein